jgi:hypothetical protein
LSTRTSSRGHLTGFNGELNAALMDGGKGTKMNSNLGKTATRLGEA